MRGINFNTTERNLQLLIKNKAMIIKHFKVPVTVKRNGDEVELIIRDDEKELIKEEEKEITSNEIVLTAKELGDFNGKQELMVRRSLMGKEQQREAFIIRKILA